MLYATRSGQGRRVAERVADKLRAGASSVAVEDVVHAPANISLARYTAVILVAEVASGQRQMVDFVSAHRVELDGIHTALVSVSDSAHGPATSPTSTDQRAKEDADANILLESFCEEAGWRPERIPPVAGALRYSQYGFVVWFTTRTITRKVSGANPVPHQIEHTDWTALDHFIEDVAGSFLIPRVTNA